MSIKATNSIYKNVEKQNIIFVENMSIYSKNNLAHNPRIHENNIWYSLLINHRVSHLIYEQFASNVKNFASQRTFIVPFEYVDYEMG